MKKILIGAIAVLILASAGTAVFIVKKIWDVNKAERAIVLDLDDEVPVDSGSEDVKEGVGGGAPVDPYEGVYDEAGPIEMKIPSGLKKVEVDWKSFSTDEMAGYIVLNSDFAAGLGMTPAEYEVFSEHSSFRRIGKITEENEYLAGTDLYLLNYYLSASDDLEQNKFAGYGNLVVFFDAKNYKIYYLEKYTNQEPTCLDCQELFPKTELGKKILTVKNDIFIPSLENPGTITLNDIGYKLIKEGRMYANSGYRTFSLGESEKILTAANGKIVYLQKDGCFVIANPDTSYDVYDLKIPDIDLNELNITSKVLNITFADGSKNTDDYYSTIMRGCGSTGCNLLVNESEDTDLAEAGKLNGKITVWEYLQMNKRLNSIFSNSVDFLRDEQKMSESEFLQDHPVLLIKLEAPLEDWRIFFTKSKYIPPVECGKPVIYLYPEETTDVSVRVAPTGGFSFTEPEYGAGWKVRADKESNLYNYADGKVYPYLFWEGFGMDYQRPNEGFVVARGNVTKFLDEKLAVLGLNAKEIADFKEFWAPKMTEKPYYFVTFLPQSDFDKIAPLSVYPRPDSVIRVFMDYQGLDRPIVVKEQKLATPERKGFAVVEWGGALNRK